MRCRALGPPSKLPTPFDRLSAGAAWEQAAVPGLWVRVQAQAALLRVALRAPPVPRQPVAARVLVGLAERAPEAQVALRPHTAAASPETGSRNCLRGRTTPSSAGRSPELLPTF